MKNQKNNKNDSNNEILKKKSNKKVVLIIVLFLIVIVVFSIVLSSQRKNNVDNSNTSNSINHHHNNIHFKVDELELMVGDIVNMDDVLFIPSNINKDEVKIDNRNSHLLRIEDGKMTAIRNGNFHLDASYNDYEISLKIKILEKKTNNIKNLYFDDFNSYLKDYEKTISVKYNDAAYIDGEIAIENDNVYLKYEKDGIMQNKKININDEEPKYVMTISVKVVRYVYILTKNGNVYLNTNNSNDIESFLNFYKINNISNVSDMFKHVQVPYFVSNEQIYNVYGEIAKHDVLIGSDEADIQTGIGNNYFIQVSNDGSLYKKIAKKEYTIDSPPESANAILNHKKQENELFKDSNNENVSVSILFGLDNDVYLIDTKGIYYKIEVIDNKEIKLGIVNSKKVSSIDKFICSDIVDKIDIYYADGSKDSYSRETNKSMW